MSHSAPPKVTRNLGHALVRHRCGAFRLVCALASTTSLALAQAPVDDGAAPSKSEAPTPPPRPDKEETSDSQPAHPAPGASAPPKAVVPSGTASTGDDSSTDSSPSEDEEAVAPSSDTKQPSAAATATTAPNPYGPSEAPSPAKIAPNPYEQSETPPGSAGNAPNTAASVNATPAAETQAPPKGRKSGTADQENPYKPQERFYFLPRLGLAVGGFSNMDIECAETGDLGCGDPTNTGHGEASGLGVFVDGLAVVLPALRLGASASWVPGVKGDAGTELRRLGAELALQAVAEGHLPLNEKTALVGRVSGGAAVLLPKGFVDKEVDQAINDCDVAIAAGITCYVDHPTPIAPTLGVGAGILWRDTGLRLDVQYQMQTFTLYKQEASTDTGTVDATVRLQQSRAWLLAGVEF